MHGGDPGRRLIEPNQNEFKFFDSVPGPFKRKEDEFLALPVYHIFGSDELSNMSPAIQERIPNPYILINEEILKEKNLKDGDEIELIFGGEKVKLPVKSDKKILKGIAGYPVGLPEIPFYDLPLWCKVRALK